MIRVAAERVNELFGLAAVEAARGPDSFADRYVRLARKVGTRYNVRLLPEYRELYCRGCSVYWVDGRTVRTRLRSGHRVQTCLVCGRVRRVRLRSPSVGSSTDLGAPSSVSQGDVVLAEAPSDGDDEPEGAAEEDA
jgi:ribonuclease P protein subunit RPR2